MTQHNNYHPCTSILIEALRNMEGGDKVLKEWDKQRQIVDKEWQAAKSDSEREITKLEASNELLHDALESNMISEKELLAYREHINILREALEDIAKTNASTHGTTQMMLAHCIKSANEALTSTPELKGK